MHGSLHTWQVVISGARGSYIGRVSYCILQWHTVTMEVLMGKVTCGFKIATVVIMTYRVTL